MYMCINVQYLWMFILHCSSGLKMSNNSNVLQNNNRLHYTPWVRISQDAWDKKIHTAWFSSGEKKNYHVYRQQAKLLRKISKSLQNYNHKSQDPGWLGGRSLGEARNMRSEGPTGVQAMFSFLTGWCSSDDYYTVHLCFMAFYVCMLYFMGFFF